MGRQYRDWRDFLVRLIEENMPSHQPYQLLHTANMVGLFSCIFVKASLKTHIRDLQVAEVKRGLGGFHGNKVRISLWTPISQNECLLRTGCFITALRTVRQLIMLSKLPSRGRPNTNRPPQQRHRRDSRVNSLLHGARSREAYRQFHRRRRRLHGHGPRNLRPERRS